MTFLKSQAQAPRPQSQDQAPRQDPDPRPHVVDQEVRVRVAHGADLEASLRVTRAHKAAHEATKPLQEIGRKAVEVII